MAAAAGLERTTVAVGYDGSEAARRAVRWAAGYAAASKSPLRVVHAWVWPLFIRNLGPVKGVEGCGLRQSAKVILAGGIEAARIAYAAAAPGTKTAAAVASGSSEGTSEGTPGTGDVDGAIEAGLPAQVLRSPAALAGAVRLAGVLGGALQLVHVDQKGNREEHGRHVPLHGQELLDHALNEARNLVPELAISGILREGRAASKELLAAAGDAEALVIGTHNREGGPGSTVSAVLHKARCNVLIAR